MALQVNTLILQDFRNATLRELELGAGMTVLVGPNATGKTNTIEALQLLTAGTSFRHPRPMEFVRTGAESARVAAQLTGDGRVVDVACQISPTRRLFRYNGKPCKPQDLIGTKMSVLFNPDDLMFVKGAASGRRQELDAYGAQANAAYDRLVRTYTRTLEQRNNFLKQDRIDEPLLEAWDESLVAIGAQLLQHRIGLFLHLSALTTSAYANIAKNEALTCTYVSSLEADVCQMGRQELQYCLWNKLHEVRNTDLRRQMTTVGPHRDDFVFHIDGREARAFASQGQQRSVVLAWKMAQVELAQTLIGEEPLLLLDDVMSELDEQRRAALTSFVESGVQTVVTTTNLGYFPHNLLEAAKVVTLKDATSNFTPFSTT